MYCQESKYSNLDTQTQIKIKQILNSALKKFMQHVWPNWPMRLARHPIGHGGPAGHLKVAVRVGPNRPSRPGGGGGQPWQQARRRGTSGLARAGAAPDGAGAEAPGGAGAPASPLQIERPRWRRGTRSLRGQRPLRPGAALGTLATAAVQARVHGAGSSHYAQARPPATRARWPGHGCAGVFPCALARLPGIAGPLPRRALGRVPRRRRRPGRGSPIAQARGPSRSEADVASAWRPSPGSAGIHRHGA
jgi:hypothetical protein